LHKINRKFSQENKDGHCQEKKMMIEIDLFSLKTSLEKLTKTKKIIYLYLKNKEARAKTIKKSY